MHGIWNDSALAVMPSQYAWCALLATAVDSATATNDIAAHHTHKLVLQSCKGVLKGSKLQTFKLFKLQSSNVQIVQCSYGGAST